MLIKQLIFTFLMTNKTDNISYISNPELSIIKKGWKGNILINNKFFNDLIPVKSPVKDVLKWKLSRNSQKEAKAQDEFQLPLIPLQKIDKSVNQLIWLGHASFLIIVNGVTLLTDPCFYDIPSIKRLVKMPCEIDFFTDIDYLLLSHDHRDHFDIKTVKKIFKLNPNIEVLTSLNFKKLLNKNNIKISKVQEAGWYQQYKTDYDLELFFLPAKHWGRRGLFDFNKTLWGSFMIKFDEATLFFSGDTSYDDNMFKEIQIEFGKIDICLLPIAAYSPSFIMKQSHTTPEEAHQIFNDLHGKLFIPMHYGTYDLSDEPLGEPIQRLKETFKNEKSNLKVLSVGEKYFL